jgi:hypothetical protein
MDMTGGTACEASTMEVAQQRVECRLVYFRGSAAFLSFFEAFLSFFKAFGQNFANFAILPFCRCGSVNTRE